jgi:hypothetical protein
MVRVLFSFGCLLLVPLLLGFSNSAALSQAKKPSTRSIDLDTLLADLKSKDEKVRTAAVKTIKGIRPESLSTPGGLKLLRAAAQKLPFDKPDPAEISAELLGLLVEHPRPEYVADVVRLFDRFHEAARPAALLLVSQLESKEAAEAYVRIFRTYAKSGKIPDASTEPLKNKPRFPEIFFPELLTYATDPKVSFELYQLCLEYCEANLLKPETLAPFTDQVLESYRTDSRELWPLQKSEGIEWIWDERYQAARHGAALLLDLMSYFPAEKVEEELQRALRYRDARLKFFGISSLLRLGKSVPPKHIEEVAASPEMRNWIYDRLRKIGKEDLFPKKYRTQAAFAESNMVDWLAYPTELGRVPSEIELMKVVSMDLAAPEGVCDYYVFRFRTNPPHESAKEGWLAGMAGPFQQKESPTTNALGHTFSGFEKWESRTPEEHVRKMRELIEEQWKSQGKDEKKPEK